MSLKGGGKCGSSPRWKVLSHISPKPIAQDKWTSGSLMRAKCPPSLITAFYSFRMTQSLFYAVPPFLCLQRPLPVSEGGKQPWEQNNWQGLSYKQCWAAGTGNSSQIDASLQQWGLNLNSWPAYFFKLERSCPSFAAQMCFPGEFCVFKSSQLGLD